MRSLADRTALVGAGSDAPRSTHVTSAMRIGGLWRWVIVGVAADHVRRHLERVLQRRRRLEAEPAHGPHVAADDDHLAEVLQACAPQYHM